MDYKNCIVYKYGKKENGDFFKCKHEKLLVNEAIENNLEGIWCGIILSCEKMQKKYSKKKEGELDENNNE